MFQLCEFWHCPSTAKTEDSNVFCFGLVCWQQKRIEVTVAYRRYKENSGY